MSDFDSLDQSDEGRDVAEQDHAPLQADILGVKVTGEPAKIGKEPRMYKADSGV